MNTMNTIGADTIDTNLHSIDLNMMPTYTTTDNKNYINNINPIQQIQ